jgi:hypothetical protein
MFQIVSEVEYSLRKSDFRDRWRVNRESAAAMAALLPRIDIRRKRMNE